VRWFGTNGIREVVGQRLTAPLVAQIAGAVARAVPVGRPIAVGWDGRTSSPQFASIVSATLTLAGHEVVELGLLPTPAIQFNVRALRAQFGVIVTASHNPPEFNGIKLIAADGLEVPRRVEEAVEALIDTGTVRAAPYDSLGRLHADTEGGSRYVDRILQLVDQEAIRKRRFTVVLDCGNGASVVTSPTLLRRLGCRVTTLNGQVDGTFPGHLSEPVEANVTDLIRAVPAMGADLGVVHDGDADRAVFVDSTGHYVPGEQMLTLLAKTLVHAHHGGIVVVPVSASQSVEDAVRPYGGEVVYTRVGSPVITREMLARKAVFGGEDNGGHVFPKFQLARDGAMTLAAVLELLAREDASLGDVLRDIPRYVVIKKKVNCPVELRSAVLERLVAEQKQLGGRFLTLDGLKVFTESGWLLLRPSGTEPLVRVYAEARTEAKAEDLVQKGVARVESAVAEAAKAAPPP
jgi:phosphomannomutase/phosphoglucomutase